MCSRVVPGTAGSSIIRLHCNRAGVVGNSDAGEMAPWATPVDANTISPVASSSVDDGRAQCSTIYSI
jgi:hypothetical protein